VRLRLLLALTLSTACATLPDVRPEQAVRIHTVRPDGDAEPFVAVQLRDAGSGDVLRRGVTDRFGLLFLYTAAPVVVAEVRTFTDRLHAQSQKYALPTEQIVLVVRRR
jgi:hypothetical protein